MPNLSTALKSFLALLYFHQNVVSNFHLTTTIPTILPDKIKNKYCVITTCCHEAFR